MMTELETVLGYAFRDADLLATALTSPAFRMDHPDAVDNQRLEFLGDAVFGLLAAETLYRTYVDEDEGALTIRRTHLASTVALAEAAERLGLRRFLRQNAAARELPSGAKPLADAMEAVLGAVWLDGGLAAVRDVYARVWPAAARPLDAWSTNPKGHLQVLAQSLRPPVQPVYTVVSVTGPDHAPTVTVSVAVHGLGTAAASGSSHHAAEAAAAAKLISTYEHR